MKTMFNEKMSSPEAQKVFFEYVAAHRGEDIEEVKHQYREVSQRIIKRELKENRGFMTSYQIG